MAEPRSPPHPPTDVAPSLAQRVRLALSLPALDATPTRIALDAQVLLQHGGWLGILDRLEAAQLAAVQFELGPELTLTVIDRAGDLRHHLTLAGPCPAGGTTAWDRWRYPAGISLALLGPDGTGKSTVAREVGAQIGQLFSATRIQHLRPGLLPELRRLLNPRKWGSPASTVVVTDPHARPPAGRLSSLLRLGYYSVDYALGYLPHVRRPVMHGELLIFDRYHPDFLADPLRWRIASAQFLRAWAVQRLPRPDLLIVLDGPAELLVARKAELPLAEVARQRQIYRELAASLPAAHLVSVQPPPDVVAARVCALILDHQQRSLRRRLRHALAAVGATPKRT